MKDPVSVLGRRIGFRFPDPALTRQALTHKTWVNEHAEAKRGDNERLEFLGDAVLELAVSERLMKLFPDATEGQLSKLRASMVDERSLSARAREKASLLADAFEAVIAAIYLQGGLQGVFRVVDRLFAEAFARAQAGGAERDYKTRLQEETQRRQLGLPSYRVVEEKGPEHEKIFVVEVEIRGEAFRAEDRTKKGAEQLGAKAALEALMQQDEMP